MLRGSNHLNHQHQHHHHRSPSHSPTKRQPLQVINTIIHNNNKNTTNSSSSSSTSGKIVLPMASIRLPSSTSSSGCTSFSNSNSNNCMNNNKIVGGRSGLVWILLALACLLLRFDPWGSSSSSSSSLTGSTKQVEDEQVPLYAPPVPPLYNARRQQQQQQQQQHQQLLSLQADMLQDHRHSPMLAQQQQQQQQQPEGPFDPRFSDHHPGFPASPEFDEFALTGLNEFGPSLFDGSGDWMMDDPYDLSEEHPANHSSDGRTSTSYLHDVPWSVLDQLYPPHPSSKHHAIPHVILFTHKTNLLGPKADRNDLRYFDNILHTIQRYTKRFDDIRSSNSNTTTRIWFLDNEECQRVLQLVEPRLVPHFLNESVGKYQGDICRAAALFLSGGYYFDADMKVIQPVNLKPETTFASAGAQDGRLFFNSYMAASPRNPILYDSLQLFLRYYEQANYHGRSLDGNGDPHRIFFEQQMNFSSYITTAKSAVKEMINNGLIGPFALKAAYDYRYELLHLRSKNDINNNDDQDTLEDDSWYSEVLVEDDLSQHHLRKAWYPQLKYQDEGIGCCCNFVVHSREQRRPYFYSRMIGAGHLCENPDWATPEARAKKALERQQFVLYDRHQPMGLQARSMDRPFLHAANLMVEMKKKKKQQLKDDESMPAAASNPAAANNNNDDGKGGEEHLVGVEEQQQQQRDNDEEWMMSLAEIWERKIRELQQQQHHHQQQASNKAVTTANTKKGGQKQQSPPPKNFTEWTWAERKARIPMINVEYFHLPRRGRRQRQLQQQQQQQQQKSVPKH